MLKGKRVLILYITERSGHHSAALAIQKGLLQIDASCDVLCVNAFKYSFPIVERITHYVYLTVIKRFPKIWEKMYDNPSLVSKSHGIKSFIHRLGVKRIKKILDSFAPDVILCTQAFPCGIVADYKRLYQSSIPLIGVLTDFAPHSFWVYDHVDHYIVPSQESKELLVLKGVKEEKIMCFGIPIDPKFANSSDKKELFANYGLKSDVPVLMIMGGGHGLGPIKDVLHELDAAENDLQMIVICGLNNRLYQWINKSRFKNRILNFKFTDQIDRLMSIATLMVTKPGGITTAEALAKKLPMIILNPIPGQEARNTQILMKNKVAVKIDTAQEVLPAINKILGSKEESDGIFSILIHKNHLSRPNSSIEIAQFALNLIRQ